MIIGIGTDLCDIRRIEKNIERHGARFIDRVFTTGEQAYCEPKSGKASYYAKRFAAKEAVAKALAGPRTGHLTWKDVEVANDPSGRPTIRLHRGATDRLKSLTPVGQLARLHISLTDDYPYAQAFAICEAYRDKTDA
ncbi:holo-ACP synthase [Fretibacter rubidus]|uniref:holo-ACP synthase n=1 Tax=Fretibacter rubidus TaxID=570162 RepID=UPI00352B9958